MPPRVPHPFTSCSSPGPSPPTQIIFPRTSNLVDRTHRLPVRPGGTATCSRGGSSSRPTSARTRFTSAKLGRMDRSLPARMRTTASRVSEHLTTGSDVARIRWANSRSVLGSSSGSSACFWDGAGAASSSWSSRDWSESGGGSANSAKRCQISSNFTPFSINLPSLTPLNSTTSQAWSPSFGGASTHTVASLPVPSTFTLYVQVLKPVAARSQLGFGGPVRNLGAYIPLVPPRRSGAAVSAKRSRITVRTHQSRNGATGTLEYQLANMIAAGEPN